MSGEGPKTKGKDDAASGEGFGGDLSPTEAWAVLEDSREAVLVDCRTQPEWLFVGVPDLRPLGKETLFIPWQIFPAMQVNPEFVDQVKAAGGREDAPVLVICRSGNRSRLAAMALAEAGFERTYNVAEGFEGGHDENRHRGRKGGWKVAGLPWVQD